MKTGCFNRFSARLEELGRKLEQSRPFRVSNFYLTSVALIITQFVRLFLLVQLICKVDLIAVLNIAKEKIIWISCAFSI